MQVSCKWPGRSAAVILSYVCAQQLLCVCEGTRERKIEKPEQCGTRCQTSSNFVSLFQLHYWTGEVVKSKSPAEFFADNQNIAGFDNVSRRQEDAINLFGLQHRRMDPINNIYTTYSKGRDADMSYLLRRHR